MLACYCTDVQASSEREVAAMSCVCECLSRGLVLQQSPGNISNLILGVLSCAGDLLLLHNQSHCLISGRLWDFWSDTRLVCVNLRHLSACVEFLYRSCPDTLAIQRHAFRKIGVSNSVFRNPVHRYWVIVHIFCYLPASNQSKALNI